MASLNKLQIGGVSFGRVDFFCNRCPGLLRVGCPSRLSMTIRNKSGGNRINKRFHYSQHTRTTALANHIAEAQSENFLCNHSEICCRDQLYLLINILKRV